MLERKSVYREIDKHDIISFDLFDTLVFRNVLNPVDIFTIVQNIYRKRFPEYNLNEYKKMRIEAEKSARKKKRAEVTLDDIYEELYLDDDIKENIKAIEKEIEYAFLNTNFAMKEIYNYALEKRKYIIITSDIYFSYDFICSVLVKCGYSEYRKLFISCEIGKRKKTGELFEYIVKELRCKPKQILHIGDNKYSDYKMSKLSGMDAICIATSGKKLYHYRKKKFDINKIQNNVVLSLIFNNKYRFNNESEYIGYSLLGLPLFSFCKWLNKNTRNLHKFFLARDGYLLFKVYEIMFPQEKPMLHYLYISRKALRRPSIYNGIPYELLIEQFPGLKEYTVKDFVDLCFVNMEHINGNFKDYDYITNFPPISGRKKLKEDVHYKMLFNKVKKIEREQYKEQYNNFKEYLKQEGFEGKVAVIDVGWRGSAQINISNIVGNVADVKGYYFGVEESAASSHNFDRSRMEGYFWNWGDNNLAKYCLLGDGKTVFECMFLSDEGSTVSYEKNIENNIVPIRDSNNLQSKQKNVYQIQNGAIQFVWDFMKVSEFLPDIDASDASAGIVDFMLYPQKKEMVIGDILAENHVIDYLAKPKSCLHYLLHPRSFFKDFYNSSWRIGFITRMIPTNRLIISIMNMIYKAITKIKKIIIS